MGQLLIGSIFSDCLVFMSQALILDRLEHFVDDITILLLSSIDFALLRGTLEIVNLIVIHSGILHSSQVSIIFTRTL